MIAKTALQSRMNPARQSRNQVCPAEINRRNAKDTARQSRNQGGVRPSSGAATPERLSASDLSRPIRTTFDAAPEDGRTPGLSEKSSQPESRLDDCSAEKEKREATSASFAPLQFKRASRRFAQPAKTSSQFIYPNSCQFVKFVSLRIRVHPCPSVVALLLP